MSRFGSSISMFSRFACAWGLEILKCTLMFQGSGVEVLVQCLGFCRFRSLRFRIKSLRFNKF